MKKDNLKFLLLIPAAYYIFALCYTCVLIPESVFPPVASDPFVYDTVADDILLTGLSLPGYPAYFISPYYAYLYAFVKSMTLDPVLMFKVIIAMQTFVFIGSVYVFYLLVGLMFRNEHASVISALLYAFYPMHLFYSQLPLKDSFGISLMVFYIYLLFSGFDKGSWRRLAGSAFLLGVLITLRGSFLPVMLICAAAVFIKTGIRHAVIFVLIAFIPIVPLTLRNVLVADDFVLTRAVSGIHAYIGNNENAGIMYIRVKGVRGDAFGHFYDAKKLAEKALGRTLKASEVNSYWKGEARRYIKDNPAVFLKLTAMRGYAVLNNSELPNNFSFGFFKANYLPFKLYGYLLYGFGSLLIMGSAGFLLCGFRYKKLLLAKFAALFLIAILTFITGRYRLPLGVLLMIGQAAFITAVIEKNIRWNKGGTLAVALIMILTFAPLASFRDDDIKISTLKHRQSLSAKRFYDERGSAEFRTRYEMNKKVWAARYRR